MNYNIRFSFLVLLLLSGRFAVAQQLTDSLLNKAPVNNAISYLRQFMGLQSGLYNGQQYLFYSRQEKENVFFQDNIYFNQGSVNYDGAVFYDVPLMYDLYRDQVISLLYDRTTGYILNTEKIKEFTLFNHHFVYRYADSLNTNGIESGLYDLIYGGKTELLIKRKKAFVTTTDQRKTYPEADETFIRKGDRYFSVGSQHRLLTILKDKKKELKKLINDNNITFEDNHELAILRIVTWYDKLTQ